MQNEADTISTQAGRREGFTEYRIKLAATDDRYGNCERCGKRCVPHYKQQYRRANQESPGWVAVGFGHIGCLRTLDWEDAEVIDE